jgi:hypothetical protein
MTCPSRKANGIFAGSEKFNGGKQNACGGRFTLAHFVPQLTRGFDCFNPVLLCVGHQFVQFTEALFALHHTESPTPMEKNILFVTVARVG